MEVVEEVRREREELRGVRRHVCTTRRVANGRPHTAHLGEGSVRLRGRGEPVQWLGVLVGSGRGGIVAAGDPVPRVVHGEAERGRAAGNEPLGERLGLAAPLWQTSYVNRMVATSASTTGSPWPRTSTGGGGPSYNPRRLVLN